MQRPSNLVVLLQSRAATQDLRQPELTDRAFHVANLSLGRRGCLHPLGRLTTYTTHHVGMGERLRRPLRWLWLVHLARCRLGDAGVQRRRPVRDDKVVLVAAGCLRCAGTRPRGKGGSHGEGEERERSLRSGARQRFTGSSCGFLARASSTSSQSVVLLRAKLPLASLCKVYSKRARESKATSARRHSSEVEQSLLKSRRAVVTLVKGGTLRPRVEGKVRRNGRGG